MKIQGVSNRYSTQHYVTIPKSIIDGFDWKKGDEVEVIILGKDKLKIEKVKS